MYEMLAAALVEDIGIEPDHVRRDATVTELELDSLSLAELAVIVTEKTGVRVEEVPLGPDMSLGALADAFEQAVAAAGPAVAAS